MLCIVWWEYAVQLGVMNCRIILTVCECVLCMCDCIVMCKCVLCVCVSVCVVHVYVLCVSGIFHKAMTSKSIGFEKEVIANRVLPYLIPLSIQTTLNKNQVMIIL